MGQAGGDAGIFAGRAGAGAGKAARDLGKGRGRLRVDSLVSAGAFERFRPGGGAGRRDRPPPAQDPRGRRGSADAMGSPPRGRALDAERARRAEDPWPRTGRHDAPRRDWLVPGLSRRGARAPACLLGRVSLGAGQARAYLAAGLGKSRTAGDALRAGASAGWRNGCRRPARQAHRPRASPPRAPDSAAPKRRGRWRRSRGRRIRWR